MADDPVTESIRSIPLEYRTLEQRNDRAERAARADARRAVVRKIFKWGFITAPVTCLLIAMFLAGLDKPRPGFQQWKCANNLKNIAAALITYANAHNGSYPDTMEELLSSSGMTSAILICPESNDTQLLDSSPPQVAMLSSGGHLSYIYAAKGVTSASSDDTVLVYEPLANHKNRGMNVLFNDYHVAFLTPGEAKELIASIVPGQPTIWSPKGGK